ncbi:hypothetical protein [Dyadobacter sp. LHD-138]|uniref:hypothetical protein n=1 Tax=Dyadobacter sp. LHD-138 TaxID=3071413 RepID=UPI0027E13A5B|nr:hypothetical protein [Dyadobacter sp. LHD-138]MDQ6479765.1 hypothetical protein [Dyadobacter sp. LHD-138]
MKTDKFEKTIRRKLESITPDFHEDDWTKMQNYMHAHTPPTFWQQYSSWLGYAAAATVTTVMAFMYVNQLSQNNHLQSDVKQLQNQIELIKNNPAVVQKTDTVYVVQQQTVDHTTNEYTQENQREERFAPQQDNRDAAESLAHTEDKETGLGTNAGQPSTDFVKPEMNEKRNLLSRTEKTGQNIVKEEVIAIPENIRQNKTGNEIAASTGVEVNSGNNAGVTNKAGSRGTGGDIHSGRGTTYGDLNNVPANSRVVFTKTLDEKFDQIATQTPVQQNNYQTVSRRMQYALAHRIAPKQIKNVLLAANPPTIKQPESQKNVTSTKKAETTIPKLNLKVPYRFGFAQQWEGKNQSKTVLAEVVVSKHFSFSAGLSWLKIKAKDFHSEKNYREKTRKNFRDDFNPQVMPFEGIENINIKPSVVQIPLTVAYRNDLKNNFTFFVGAGTNLTVKQKQDITFDSYRDIYIQSGPKPYIVRATRSEQITEKMNLNLVNSLNFSAGIEKSWHPVVLQAEGYLYTYFLPLSPLTSRSGPGFKIKFLYQIGKKM